MKNIVTFTKVYWKIAVFYFDLFLYFCFAADFCVVAAIICNKITREPSRYAERTFLIFSLPACGLLFTFVLIYSVFNPEIKAALPRPGDLIDFLNSINQYLVLGAFSLIYVCLLTPVLIVLRKIVRHQSSERALLNENKQSIAQLKKKIRLLQSENHKLRQQIQNSKE